MSGAEVVALITRREQNTIAGELAVADRIVDAADEAEALGLGPLADDLRNLATLIAAGAGGAALQYAAEQVQRMEEVVAEILAERPGVSR